ncbi:uncharacterized protein F5891DRAFT_1198692 [Suillus fuscotomentosus]|uniref:Uncharacterized protein n=1 Tax=Suillus fuscotomentosus TaxID=1912939 RepID=A0AAD4DQ31_9AGAM|nr:uncharacterized protein F5891DRAFT_1198692 [Suillus fuscotomentosus]KAG1889117.1 hypothetical protein F5891DRAFT_1198692 [Suillus fuscotomentosus]
MLGLKGSLFQLSTATSLSTTTTAIIIILPSSLKVTPWFFVMVLTPLQWLAPNGTSSILVLPRDLGPSWWLWSFVMVVVLSRGPGPFSRPWSFLTVLVLPRGPGISSWSWSFFMVVALRGSGSGPYFLVYTLFLSCCFHLL